MVPPDVCICDAQTAQPPAKIPKTGEESIDAIIARCSASAAEIAAAQTVALSDAKWEARMVLLEANAKKVATEVATTLMKEQDDKWEAKFATLTGKLETMESKMTTFSDVASAASIAT